MALLFSVWWLYFSIPFDDILDEERRRHDFVSFGYGHFFIFTALAGLGSTLKLVTEVIDETGQHRSWRYLPTLCHGNDYASARSVFIDINHTAGLNVP